MKEVVKEGYKRCPNCIELQDNEAIICKKCQYKFKKTPKTSWNPARDKMPGI
jgi:hypothetical protein